MTRFGRQRSQDWYFGRCRSKDATLGQQGDRILGIRAQTLVSDEEERRVSPDRKPKRAAELLTIQRILERCASDGQTEIRKGPIQRQRGTECKRVAGVHRVIPEEAIEAAMNHVCARLGDDVDGRAASTPQFGGIVAAVNLKFPHLILTDVNPDSATF